MTCKRVIACLVFLALAVSSGFCAEKIVLKGKLTIGLPDRNTEVTLEPLKIVKVKGEEKKITGAKPSWSSSGARLNAASGWAYGVLKKGSISIYSSDNKKFEEGKDYLVDWEWSVLGRASGSKMEAGKKYLVDYQYAYSRVDLVEVDKAGKVKVKTGIEDKTCPQRPDIDDGCTPLFAVYMESNTEELSDKNILMIDVSTPKEVPVTGKEFIPNTKDKLKNGKPLTVVCIGDSITDGSGLGDNKYVEVFKRYMKKTYPNNDVKVINAGVGGDTSEGGLGRLDKDVLKYNPDLVTVMYGVNDENTRQSGGGRAKENGVPVPKYKTNMGDIVDKIRAKGAEVILITTSMKNLGWEGTCGNLNEYAKAIRELGQQKKVCVVDNFAHWENRAKWGHSYLSLLDTCINHPNVEGHQIFFEGLKRAIEN